MKCKHENADHLMSGEGWALMDGTEMPDAVVEQLRCLNCGAWLPLGPANESGEHAEAVAIEIRAAELSDAREPRLWCEGCGWNAHEHETLPAPYMTDDERQFHAGYLARCIYAHGGEQ